LIFGGLTLSTIGRQPKEALLIERRATQLADLAPIAHHDDAMADIDQFLGVGGRDENGVTALAQPRPNAIDFVALAGGVQLPF
jgi:hypothetical protein